MDILREDDPRFRPANQLMEDAEYTEAIRQFDALAPKLSGEDRWVALYWKARCLAALGEWRQERPCLDEALKQVDTNSPLAIWLKLESASVLRFEEGPERAVVEIRSLLDQYAEELKSPDLFWPYVQAKTNLGNLLVEAGHHSEAINELEEALALQDDPLSRYYIYFSIGAAFQSLGELAKARDQFEHALREAQSAPAAGISPYYAARLRYELALNAYKQNQPGEARRQLKFALAVSVASGELSRFIGQLKVLLDQYDLRAHDPRFRPAMELIEEGRYTEAIPQLDGLLLKLKSVDRVAALYWKVRCFALLGDRRAGKPVLEEALKQADADSPITICLRIESASLLRAEEGAEKAAQAIQSLLAQHAEELKSPDLFWIKAQAKTNLGNYLIELGRHSEAVKELEEALALQDEPRSRYYIHVSLGEAFQSLGELANARDQFERALREASAPKAGISPYYAARLQYGLALNAYKQKQLGEARRQLEFALALPVTDHELSGAIGELRELLDRAEARSFVN